MEVKLYKLKEICSFVTGIDPNNNEKNGKIPFIKLGNTHNYEINYETSEKINSCRKKITTKGEIILCWSCSVGKSFIIKEDCFFSTAFYKLEAIKKVYLNKYLHFYFIKNENNISKLATGSVLKKANMSILGNVIIKLPNLKMQQEIINIIEPKEKLFIKYNKIINISNIEKFKESWFHLINIIEPFEEIYSNIKKKFDIVDKIFQAFVSNIKKTSKLEDLSNVFAGQSPPQFSKYWSNGNIPFININHLTNNPYVINSNVYLNEVGFSKFRCKTTTNYSILVGKVSPDKNKISVIDNGFVVNGAIRIVEPKDKKCYAQLFESIKNSAFILSKISCGSVQQQINSLQLSNLVIKFDDKYNEIFEKQLKYKKNLIKQQKIINKIIELLILLKIV